MENLLTAAESGTNLMVIVPAFNEEGAIAGVVQSVHREMPGTPVVVIDDCSTDATVERAQAAGGFVLSVAHHLGLAAAFKPVTSWPSNWVMNM